MALDADIKLQLTQYLQLLESDIVLKVSLGSDKVSDEMLALVDELASLSSKITVKKLKLPRTPSFSINRVGRSRCISYFCWCSTWT